MSYLRYKGVNGNLTYDFRTNSLTLGHHATEATGNTMPVSHILKHLLVISVMEWARKKCQDERLRKHVTNVAFWCEADSKAFKPTLLG